MTNDTKGKRKGKSQGSGRSATDEFAEGFVGVSSDLAGSGDDRRTSSFTGSGDDR
jgi:hypothetical protein